MPRLGLYQPFIEDRNVRRLYRLKAAFRENGRRVPMTTLLNRILDDFFAGEGSSLQVATRVGEVPCSSLQHP